MLIEILIETCYEMTKLVLRLDLRSNHQYAFPNDPNEIPQYFQQLSMNIRAYRFVW